MCSRASVQVSGFTVKTVILHCEIVSSDNGPVRRLNPYSSAQILQLKPYGLKLEYVGHI